jgi:hypothetical protein
VGRGGLEPPTSAVIGPERGAYESGRPSVGRGVIRREPGAPYRTIRPYRSGNMRQSILPFLGALLLVATSACGSASSTVKVSPAQSASSTPTSESPTPIACAASSPSPRAGPATAFDPATRTVVVFGGDVGAASVAETWLYAGGCWTQAKSVPTPLPRQSGILVYDPDVHRLLLLGGRNDNPTGPQTSPGDVWTWDGQTWSPVAGAPHFGDAAAAYDSAHHVVVVLGGSNEGVGTWTWDGTTWSRLCSEYPQASCIGKEPNAARGSEAMCYDPGTKSILVFGGAGSGVPIYGDTWLWNGTAWTLQKPAHSPTSRFAAAMTCGPQPLIYGGWGDYQGLALDDTWSWEGTDWQLLSAHGPGAKPVPMLFGVFDGSRDLVFAGTMPGEIWAWNGSGWTATS